MHEIYQKLRAELLSRQCSSGMWRGRLSSSAISTSVSIFALHSYNKELYATQISAGARWLHSTMLDDGSWGDSPESPANLTATLLSYAALYACDIPPQKTLNYLTTKFGGTTDEHIIEGVLKYYGTDLTFSVPILVMCGSAGVIGSWGHIPQLPFELSTLPQRLFRFLRLPVVSYAIPALIAVGILRYKKGKRNLLREKFIPRSLEVLKRLQPLHGGFLEAAPLTAFVTMCMCKAGYADHTVTVRCVQFLADTVREDGSWAIDTDLSCWVTSLSVRALGIENDEQLAAVIRANSFKYRHPFTGARAGGWGWSDLQGAVPDADDTSGALVALHSLLGGRLCDEATAGIEWLLALQNSDGGIPTFCRGWGKLPFDRSSPDISAHTLLAFELWHDTLPIELQRRVNRSIKRIVEWLYKNQLEDGSWHPLWFGDQDAHDEQSPIYGTAVVVEHLGRCREPQAAEMVLRGKRFLVYLQNSDGGYGAGSSKVTLTGAALAAMPENHRAAEYLCERYRAGTLEHAEPIGLYFARLWYSEELYNLTYALRGFRRRLEYLDTVNKP